MAVALFNINLLYSVLWHIPCYSGFFVRDQCSEQDAVPSGRNAQGGKGPFGNVGSGSGIQMAGNSVWKGT